MLDAHRQRCAQVVLALLLMAAGHSRAQAQLCFPPPHGLPGLPGAPDWWSGTTTARSDADEPRWAAAPISSFDSDLVGSQEGAYRVLYDPGANQLVVSVQALTDLGNSASDLDSVYFGLSTNAAATTAHAVRIDLFAPNGTPDPKSTGLTYVPYEFATGGGWTLPGGPFASATPPAWLENAAAWVEPGGAADWTVNFRVNLSDAGLLPGAAFKIALGLHMHNELGAGAVDLTTPDVGAAGAVADLVQNPHTPTSWLAADAANSGCVSGIALESLQIGSRNAQPNKLDTSPGAVNRLFATPTIPATLPLTPNLFQAEFRVARWGSIADSHAPWTAVPGAVHVINGPPSAPDLQSAEFVCPANTATHTCGIPTPGEPHQCVLVELSKVPGSSIPVRFTKAAAYRNMRFEDLSELSDRAFVSVAGLEAALGDQVPRTLYLYVDMANMPEHGDKPLWLPGRAMAETRRIVDSPPPAPPQRAAPVRGRAALVAAPPPPSSVSPAASLPWPKSPRPEAWLAYSDERMLRLAWPTYAIHVYYELGSRAREDKREYVRLEPMYPFIYHFAHDGSLYGFAQRLSGRTAQLTELQPHLYQVSVPNEGELELQVRVSAEEGSKHAQECTAIENLKQHKSCACSAVGAAQEPGALAWACALVWLLACSLRLQRRRSAAARRQA
jgi:hypothetical protein